MIKRLFKPGVVAGVRCADGVRCHPAFAQETSEAQVQHQLRPQEDVPQRRYRLAAATTATPVTTATGAATAEEKEVTGIACRQRSHNARHGRDRGTEADGK